MRGVRRAHGAAGLTMVELLVAAAVVLVAIVAIATIFPVAMSDINLGGDETVAAALAHSFGELIRNESSFNTLKTYNFNTCPATPASTYQYCQAFKSQVQGRLQSGQANVTVTTVANPATNQDLATVVVTVSWRPRGESWLPFTPRRSVTFATRRSQ